jgi:hypothetical protein
MHPTISHQLAPLKMAEQLHEVERERRLRAAVSNRPRSIDTTRLSARLRLALLRLAFLRPGPGARGNPVGAGT